MFNSKKIYQLEARVHGMAHEIEQLRGEIKTLEKNQQFYNPLGTRNLGESLFLRCFPGTWEQLKAEDIIDRFEELYKHLGIERALTPAKPSEPVLRRRKKSTKKA